MHCPRCDVEVLEERERDGVTVDVCPKCRGVWLDRGELEKIIARAAREPDPWDGRPTRAPGAAGGGRWQRDDERITDRHEDRRRRRDDDDDDDDDDRRGGGFFGSLRNLFD